MTFRRALSIVLVALLGGLLVGIMFSGDELISVRIWIGTSAVIVVTVAVRDLVVASNPEPMTLERAWRRTSQEQPSQRPLEMRNLQALVVSANANPRMFSRRLRPHLVELAEHFLPRRHGISFDDDGEEAAQLLGDVSWLIEPGVDDRIPTFEEIGRFLDVVVGPEPAAARLQSNGVPSQ